MPQSNAIDGVDELVQKMDALHHRVAIAQCDLFRLIAEADACERWRDWGAWSLAHWLSMRYGISHWKARRWIAAAHALKDLPRISEAFASGELSVDKTVELTRFATPQTEAGLIPWSVRVSGAAIRERADRYHRSLEEAQQAEDARSVHWWYFDENSRFGLQAELPAAQGAVVARALDRMAKSLPVMPGEEDPSHTEARRADALVAVCSTRIAEDADPDRATVVVHARLDGLLDGSGGCEIEGGVAIHPEVAKRLLCDARIQAVIEDGEGTAVGVGRMMREPPPWMMRQLKYRDRECTFPGCGARRFLHAHHIRWWERDGRTDLDNLTLACTFHHKLVHEFRWRVKRDTDGTARWFHPNGTPYRAGPAPPRNGTQRQPSLSAVGF